MMFNPQGASKHTCSLLAVTCGKNFEDKKDAAEDKPRYPLPELVSSGRLEVHARFSDVTFPYQI